MKKLNIYEEFIIKKFFYWLKLIFKKENNLKSSDSLVEFEANKYIHGSYHHNKFQEAFNLDKFLTLMKSSIFKEHKEFNEISNFFQPSIEIIAKEILDELNENGLKRKDPRLKLFLDDLKKIIDIYKIFLHDFDLINLEYFYQSARKNVMSQNANLNLATADMINLLQKYQVLEKKIIENIINNLSNLVSRNHIYVLGQFWYDNDETTHQNLTENKINKYLKLLYIILMNKNITKEEITKLFEKLLSDEADYTQLIGDCSKIYFKSDYPLDLPNTFDTLSEYRYEIMQSVDELTIEDRFKRFIELFYEEKDCFYVFKILNTEISKVNEVQYGGITYYNEKILKSKGYKNRPDLAEYGKDGFRNKKEVKAIIPYKTKRYFSNISALKVRSIIENNISFFKLINGYSDEKARYFKPSSSKMDVSYSYIVLDNDYFIIDDVSTIYDGDGTLNKNTIFNGIFEDNELNSKLDLLMKHLNYKQIENGLTTNDYLILQSLQKYKQAIESRNFTDLLLLSWNGLEFLSKAIDNKNKIDAIQGFASLVYSFIYTNKFHKWDLSKIGSIKEIDYRAKHLVVYAYTYRNKIVHSHLIENSLMISIAKGINIIFNNILILFIEKIVFSPDFDLENIVNQLKSDLNKNAEKMKNENTI